MFDVSLQIKKLEVFRQWLFEKIDGMVSSLEEKYRVVETEHDMDIINKPKELSQSFIKITDHAYQRAKERLSMNHGSFTKIAEKAFTDGLVHSDCAGNLKKYLDKLYLSHPSKANNIKIYGEIIFLFNYSTLITVYQLPTNLRKAALKNQKILRT